MRRGGQERSLPVRPGERSIAVQRLSMLTRGVSLQSCHATCPTWVCGAETLRPGCSAQVARGVNRSCDRCSSGGVNDSGTRSGSASRSGTRRSSSRARSRSSRSLTSCSPSRCGSTTARSIQTTLIQYASAYARGGVDALAREIQRTQASASQGPLFVRTLGTQRDLVFLSMPDAWRRFDLSQLATPPLNGEQQWAALETGGWRTARGRIGAAAGRHPVPGRPEHRAPDGAAGPLSPRARSSLFVSRLADRPGRRRAPHLVGAAAGAGARRHACSEIMRTGRTDAARARRRHRRRARPAGRALQRHARPHRRGGRRHARRARQRRARPAHAAHPAARHRGDCAAVRRPGSRCATDSPTASRNPIASRACSAR